MKTFYFAVSQEMAGKVVASNSRLAFLRWKETVRSVAPGVMWRLFEGEKLSVYCVETSQELKLPLEVWIKISCAAYPAVRHDPKPILESVRNYKEHHGVPTMKTVAGIA